MERCTDGPFQTDINTHGCQPWHRRQRKYTTCGPCLLNILHVSVHPEIFKSLIGGSRAKPHASKFRGRTHVSYQGTWRRMSKKKMPTPQFSDQSPTVWCAVAYQQLAWHFKLRSDWASQAAVGSMQLFVSLSVWLIGSRYGLTQVVAGTASCWHSHGFSTFCQAASKSKSGKFSSFSGEGWKNSTSYGWICLHFVYPKWKMGWLAPSGASEWRGGSTIFNHAAWVLSCQFDLCKLLQPCFPMFSHFWSACHGEVKSELPSRAKTRSARSARTRLRRNSKNFRENGNCRVQPVYILILFNIVASCWLFLHLMFIYIYVI